jgi:hypothetical protein
MQFSLALATTVSVFIKLWCLDNKISWLGGWASQLLHPPKKRRRLDVSQILSGRGMDPTLLLRRSERSVMAMQCNFHRLQFIVFTKNW